MWYNKVTNLDCIKNLEYFSNVCIVYKILLTILVIVIYEEISFSELKVIKSYLISIMSQQD